MSWKIAVAQLEDIQGDVPKALQRMTEKLREADAQAVDVLCFPECFLQGYTLDMEQTKARALSLGSTAFNAILAELAIFKSAAIVGMIEEANGEYFNTAAVIHRGKVIGTYRKVHLFEKNFTPGEEYPIFAVNGLKFGINICYDARFSEGALLMAEQGAQVVFYLLNNRLPVEKATKYRDKHILNLVDRAQESDCLVVSSDVVCQGDSEAIGYGCSAVVQRDGRVVKRIPELTNGMTIYESL